MSSQPLSRIISLSTALNASAILGSTLYLRSHLVHNYEESEARMDEIEGTLRGHIGMIEGALERLEKKTGSEGNGDSGEGKK